MIMYSKMLRYPLLLLFFTLSTTFLAKVQSGVLKDGTRIPLNKEAAFDQALFFLLEKNYFIQSSDRASGYIQYIVIKKDSNFFGTRDGYRYVVNLLLRETSSNETKIYQQVNVEHRMYKNSVLYLDDRGITADPKIFQPFMDNLVEYLLEVVKSE